MRSNLVWLFVSVFIFISFSAHSQKDPNSKSYPKFIKEDAKTNRSTGKNIFKKHFDITSDDDMLEERSLADQLGFTHDKFQQYYKKVKVEGATYTIHSRNGMIESLSGEFKSIKSLDVKPIVSESQAFEAAVKYVGAKTYAWDPYVVKGYPGYQKPKGELVIIGGGDDDHLGLALVWKFDIYAADPLYRAFVYVDAKTGKVAFENNRIHQTNISSSGTSLFNGTVNFTADFTGSDYRLRQTSSGNGIETYSLNNGTNYANAVDVTSSSISFTNDPTAVQAHWGAERTYDYYKTKFGRNSFDNAGAKILSYVHYSTNYVNAFWDGQRMTYGDGNLTQGYEPLVSLDIVGHEITHAVTEKEANLTYSYESGALNESFSDIFGEAVEFYSKGSNDWLMGCDIGVNGCGAFRSMANPNLYGDPDTYKGTNWYSGTGDNGGVHYNSGVQNKWFYILVNGESGTNDLGNSYSVTGIGMDKAAAIAYRTLTIYLTASSNYSNARQFSIQSAIDLYGSGSPEVIATTNAWFAVGVGCNSDGTVCPPVSYCSSKGNSQVDEWIANVSIGSFSNSSAASPYTFFSSKTINLVAGSSNSLSLTPGFTSVLYPEYWRIWIDYNNDKDFEDAGELVYDAGSASTAVRTGTFVVSSTASGTTRMRVSMKYNAAPTPCEVFSYGEVEDYVVSFTAPQPVNCVAPTGLNSSSTLGTNVTLTWNAVTDASGYRVEYKRTTSNTWTLAASSNTTRSITISGLTPLATYDWRVTTLCGGVVGASTQTQFTTPDSYESNNTASAAKTISVNTNIIGAISNAADQDWFKFTISRTSKTKNLKIDLSNMPLNYDITLFNSATSTTQIGQKSYSGSGATRVVSIVFNNNASTNVTYYLKVNGDGETFSPTSSYTLRINTSSSGYLLPAGTFTSKANLVPISEESIDPEFSIYPVPAQDRISIRYQAEDKGLVSVRVFDINGKQMFTENKSIDKGVNIISVKLGMIPSGNYIIQVAEKNKLQLKRFGVKR